VFFGVPPNLDAQIPHFFVFRKVPKNTFFLTLFFDPFLITFFWGFGRTPNIALGYSTIFGHPGNHPKKGCFLGVQKTPKNGHFWGTPKIVFFPRTYSHCIFFSKKPENGVFRFFRKWTKKCHFWSFFVTFWHPFFVQKHHFWPLKCVKSGVQKCSFWVSKNTLFWVILGYIGYGHVCPYPQI